MHLSLGDGDLWQDGDRAGDVTNGLKGVFHHTTQTQLWTWILIRDLLRLALETCHPGLSSSSPAWFVPSSAQKKTELNPTFTLGDGKPHPEKDPDLTQKERPSYYQEHKMLTDYFE